MELGTRNWELGTFSRKHPVPRSKLLVPDAILDEEKVEVFF